MTINNEETTSSTFSFSINEYCMSKDYEGALDGDNDIYFKYKIHFDGDPEDMWYGWSETPVNSIELTRWKWCGYPIINHSSRNFTVLIEMWEEDVMSDEFVADEYWQNCQGRELKRDYLGHYYYVDHDINDQHYLYNTSSSNYRQWELRDGLNTYDRDQVRIEWSFD